MKKSKPGSCKFPHWSFKWAKSYVKPKWMMLPKLKSEKERNVSYERLFNELLNKPQCRHTSNFVSVTQINSVIDSLWANRHSSEKKKCVHQSILIASFLNHVYYVDFIWLLADCWLFKKAKINKITMKKQINRRHQTYSIANWPDENVLFFKYIFWQI